MRVRALSIRNFRGIRELDWTTSSHFVCLIGPGDSCKSTLLDAIGLALSSRWSVPISDADFFDCDTSLPISITVTVSDLPAELKREEPYGHWLRGITSEGSIADEPEADDEVALSVRFEVDDALEPTWTLAKEARQGHEGRISARARSAFGVFQVDDRFDAHLRWAPGSALSHLSGAADVAAVLTQAQREARRAVFDNPSADLMEAAGRASTELRALGGASLAAPRPGLDPTSSGRSPSLVLHDNEVPATQLGLGSRRLASLAFQLAALNEESVVLVDEVEHGLEPHRLLHVLDHLRRRAESGKGQVILTTHSSLVVEAVNAPELHIVRNRSGVVTVRQVPHSIGDMKNSEPQATIRSGPSAMLADRVIVCEGKTEVGLSRAMVKHWDLTADKSLVLIGTAIRHGAGHEAPVKARCLAELGYPTALLIDNDLSKENKHAFDAQVAKAAGAGVEVITWEDGCSIEEQIVRSLPDAALAQFVQLAASLLDTDDPEASVRDAVSSLLGCGSLTGLDPLSWQDQSDRTLDDVRTAVGAAAKKKGWFKGEARGEQLGEFVVQQLDHVDPASQLRQTLDLLRLFAYGGTVETEPEAVATG